MSKPHLNVLVDTNVWLDYLLGRAHAESAVSLLSTALDHDDAIAVTPSIMKDVFFLVCASLKRSFPLADDQRLPEPSAQAINEIAWDCLATVQHDAIVLNQGFQEHLEAMTLRDMHPDYEDDLLLATAKLSHIDYIVTNDKALLTNTVVPAITPEEYLALKRN